MQTQTIEGAWTIFPNDQTSYYGVLEYKPEEGISLSVKIPQSKTATDIFKEMNPYKRRQVTPSIIGFDEHNKPVSLFACGISNDRNRAGLNIVELSALRCIRGIRASCWHELKSERIQANLTLLHEWMGRAPQFTVTEQGVKIEEANPIEIELDGYKLLIHRILSQSSSRSSYEIIDNHYIEFRPANEAKVDELNSQVISFARMLTLMTGTPVFVESETLGRNASQEVFCARHGISKANRSLQNRGMLVTYNDIENNAGIVIKNWYNLAANISDAIDLYSSVAYGSSLNMNQEFLFLAQGLEVYHRAHSKFIARAQSKRKHDDKTLAERLTEVLEENQGAFKEVINDFEEFTSVLVKIRNHLTHYGSRGDGREKAKDFENLMKLTDQMKLVFELSILSDLGIAGAAISRRLASHKSREYMTL